MRNRSSIVLVLLLGWTHSLLADVVYHATDLGTLGRDYSEGLAINDAGQVTSYSDAPSSFHAFLYSNGHMADLGTLSGGLFSQGFGINNAGQVVGESDYHVFLYSNGHMTDLNSLVEPGPGTTLYDGRGINDAGQVTGTARTVAPTGSFQDHAFIYSNGHITYLGALNGVVVSNGPVSLGLAINDAGQVTGNAATFFSDTHAFLYSNGHMKDLGTLGGAYSTGRAINDEGQVTGDAATTTTTLAVNYYHVFLYSNGHMTDLGTLSGGDFSQGFGINDAGQVVGESATAPSDGNDHAFLYSNGHMTDLNSLVEPGLGTTLYEAQGINDKGQIVANGRNDHAYLLTPTPEPSTLILFGTALLGVLVWSRRRRESSFSTFERLIRAPRA
jgi:probable HAF family extracellular repeat protein